MMRSLFALLACTFALLASPACVPGLDLHDLEIDHSLSFDFPTPHTKWAKPYAAGKLRVLFFTDGRGLNPRECVELMQRFDIEAQAVFRTNVDDGKETLWHGGELGERRMLGLLRQKWDCIVFLGLSSADVPARQKQLIVDAVTEGTGIVFVGSDDGLLLPGKKASSTSFVDPEDVNAAYTVGQGRGITLFKPTKTNYYEGWEVDYDYRQERLGRAIFWAAQKEPRARLELSASPLSRPAGGEPALRLEQAGLLHARLSGLGAHAPLTLKVALRSPGHQAIRLPDRVISGQNVEFSLPRLSEGNWHADARVLGPAGVVTWATLPFRVQSDRLVPALRLDKNWGEPGGAITGRVILSGPPKPKELLRVQLLDRRRRELARRDVPVTGDSAEFEFPIADWLPMLVTVEARLISGNREISRAYKYFHVTKRKQNRFNFLMWGAPQGTLAPYAEEILARNGVTLQLDWENPPLQVGAHDISWVPFTTELSADKTPAGIMAPFCWNDGHAVKKQIDTLVSLHRGSREQGAFVYSIGDENKTLGSCLSPFCAEQYRVFLRESYGSLAALNRSWQTRFESWNEVGLSTPKDDDELGSQRSGNYPRWFDRQAYKSWNYVQYCLKYSKAYRELDPKAKTGFDGAGGFATGDDLDLIVRSMGSWVPYQSLGDEVIRSIAPRDFVRSNWIGGRDKTAGPLLQKYWRLVTLGSDSVWWWMWNYVGQNLRGFLAPDLSPYPEIKEMVEDTRIVREGLGDLLLASTMQDDGIAVLYSYPSVFASKLEAAGSFGGYEEAHGALVKFIRDSGFQFRYLTDRMLRQGEVDLSKYKIIFLPRAEALGDHEARAMVRFVEQGGTLVADFRPGSYDEHCKARAKGALDDLFGIRHKGKAGARSIQLRAGGESRKTASDAGILLNGAQAQRRVDGIPLWLTRTVGKGRTILLNAEMKSLPALVSSGTPKGKFWGFDPVVKLARLDGTRPDDVDVTRWQDGKMEIVSVLSRGKMAEKMALSFPGSKYVYDLRAGKSYGPCQRCTATILPDRASFFILVDRAEAAPQLRLASSTVLLGQTLHAELSVPGAQGVHALQVRVDAGGRHLAWQDQTLTVGAKPVSLELPVAYNDPAGEYRITVRDLFSGAKQISAVSVQKNRQYGSR